MSWTLQSTTPEPSYRATYMFINFNGKPLLTGGNYNNVMYNDVWVLGMFPAVVVLNS